MIHPPNAVGFIDHGNFKRTALLIAGLRWNVGFVAIQNLLNLAVVTYHNHSFTFALHMVQLNTEARAFELMLFVNIFLIICRKAKAAFAVMVEQSERYCIFVHWKVISDISDFIISLHRLGVKRRPLVWEQIVVYKRHFRHYWDLSQQLTEKFFYLKH